MRVWLQKQKKKEEAKAAAQAATPAPETTPAATEAPSEVAGPDKPIDSVEEAPVTGNEAAEPAAAVADGRDGQPRTVSASAQPNEVGLLVLSLVMCLSACIVGKVMQRTVGNSGWLKTMNTIDPASAGGCSMHIRFVLLLISGRVQRHLRSMIQIGVGV